MLSVWYLSAIAKMTSEDNVGGETDRLIQLSELKCRGQILLGG